MTKSSIDRKRSRYGEFVCLRFHKPIKTYHLSINNGEPMLLAKFTEVDGDLAVYCWETFEKLYQEKKELKSDVNIDFVQHQDKETKQIIINLEKDKGSLIRLCEEFHIDWHKVIK